MWPIKAMGKFRNALRRRATLVLTCVIKRHHRSVIASEAKQSRFSRKQIFSTGWDEIAASPSAPRNDIIISAIYATKY